MRGSVSVSGPPDADLLFEDRDDRAAAAEDVAESHGCEHLVLPGGGADHPDHPLGEELRHPEHRRRVNRLVGRHVHEPSDAVRECGLRDVAGSRHVVEDRLVRIGLHQRHVLVGGRVEDDGRLELLHRVHDLRAITDVPDDDREIELGHGASELAADVVQRVLAVAVQDDLARLRAGDLPHQLRADRPTGARDQRGPVLQVRGREVERHGLAAQEVLHLHRPDARQLRLADEHLRDAREDPVADARVRSPPRRPGASPSRRPPAS